MRPETMGWLFSFKVIVHKELCLTGRQLNCKIMIIEFTSFLKHGFGHETMWTIQSYSNQAIIMKIYCDFFLSSLKPILSENISKALAFLTMTQFILISHLLFPQLTTFLGDVGDLASQSKLKVFYSEYNFDIG